MGIAVNIYELAIEFIVVSGLKYPEEIAIEYIGLRPGEKLHEELTYKEEILIAESTSKIKKYSSKVATKKMMLIKSLCLLKPETPSNETVMKLKEIVPEFISNNSKYESLDK